MSRKSNRDFLYIESEADAPYWVPGVRIPHFPQSVEFGKLNKMQKGMEVIDFHFFVGNSACWEFIIIKVLWFTKRKGAYTLSFVFCLVGRREALHRMPPAGIRFFEVGGVAARCPRIPHFPLMTNQIEVIEWICKPLNDFSFCIPLMANRWCYFHTRFFFDNRTSL